MGLRSKGSQPQVPEYLRKTKLIFSLVSFFDIELILICFFASFVPHRSLSELEAFCVGTDAGEKVRQVTERATMFKIASDAMINVSETVTN